MRNLFAIFKESEDTFQGKEAGEKVLLILRRHVFTLAAPLTLVFLAAFVPILTRLSFGEAIARQGWGPLFLFLTSLWYALLWLAAFYTLTMYALNTVILTDRRIIENEQIGLFNRKVSELHLYRVQDVSVRVEGFFETLLSFGSVSVQTAAAEREFVFAQIAHPEQVKDAIMQAVAAKKSTFSLA